MSKKKPSKQPSPDREIVRLRFPGWVFWPHTSEDDENVIVRVRLLGPEERDALEGFMLPLDFSGFCQRLISLSMVDRDGNRALSEEDGDVLNRETPTLLFVLAHAILEANGMLPPPDQNMGHGKYVPFESINAALAPTSETRRPEEASPLPALIPCFPSSPSSISEGSGTAPRCGRGEGT